MAEVNRPEGVSPRHKEAEVFLDKLRGHLTEKFQHVETRKYISEEQLVKNIVPAVNGFLQKPEGSGFDATAARTALLAEGYATKELRNFASGSPSGGKYPFKKGIAAALKNAKNEWWKEGRGLYDACPDFALRAPNKYSIVFECKLFKGGGKDQAKATLVNGVYECSFYRGLPTLFASKGPNASSYDYACLLVYDSSANESVRKAWGEVNEGVKRSCWEALHVYVMALPA